MFCDVFGARGALPWGRSADTPSPQGIPQAVLLGHDWGSMVVWNMALFYPERVRWVLGSPRGSGHPKSRPVRTAKPRLARGVPDAESLCGAAEPWPRSTRRTAPPTPPATSWRR